MPQNPVFIDTNVWFSAFYGSPNAEKIATAHIQSQIQGVISEPVLQELIVNLKTKIPLALPSLRQLLSTAPPQILKNPPSLPPNFRTLAHPKDAPLLLACYQAKIPFFVTGNLKDFHLAPIKQKLNINVLPPADAVKLWKL